MWRPLLLVCAYLAAVRAQQSECVVNKDDAGNEWGLCGSPKSPDGRDYYIETVGMSDAIKYTASYYATQGMYSATSNPPTPTVTTTATRATAATATSATTGASTSATAATTTRATAATVKSTSKAATTSATTAASTSALAASSTSATTAYASTNMSVAMAKRQILYTYSGCRETCVSYYPYWLWWSGAWWPLAHLPGLWSQYLSWCWCSSTTCGYYNGPYAYWNGRCTVNYGYQRVQIWTRGRLQFVWYRLGTGCCCQPNYFFIGK